MELLAQSVAGGVDFIESLIQPFYEPFSLVCWDVYRAVEPIGLVIIFMGLLKASYDAMYGTLEKVWRHIVFSGVVALSIPYIGQATFFTQEWVAVALMEQIGMEPWGVLDRMWERFGDNMSVFQVSPTPLNILGLVAFWDWLVEWYLSIFIMIYEFLLIMVLFFCLFFAFLIQVLGLYMGVALSPIFASMLMFEPTRSTGMKYLMGLLCICFWPLGWGLGFIVMDAMFEFGSSTDDFGPLGDVLRAVYMIPVLGNCAEALVREIVLLVGVVWGIAVLLKAPKKISAAIESGAQIGTGLVGSAIGLGTSAIGSVVSTAAAVGGAVVGGAVTGGAGSVVAGAAAGAATRAAGKAAGGAIKSAGKG